jgi:hypothetical protein
MNAGETSMKLRMKGNTLRLRVTRSEIERLIRTGRIEESTWFGIAPESCFTYALEQSPEITGTALRYAAQKITVLLPASHATQWKESDQVGIYAIVDLGSRGPLEVSLEKDFCCLDRSDADNLDMFPNPQIGALC